MCIYIIVNSLLYTQSNVHMFPIMVNIITSYWKFKILSYIWKYTCNLCGQNIAALNLTFFW